MHATVLLNACQYCGQPIRGKLSFSPTDLASYCTSCQKRLGGNPFGSALWPMPQEHRQKFRKIFLAYEKAYQRVVGLELPATDEPWNHWKIMQVALNQGARCHWVSFSEQLERIDSAQGKFCIAINRRRASRKSLEESGEAHDATLIAVHKAFRRHLEAAIPYRYRRVVNREKKGNHQGNIPNWEAAGPFLTWNLFYRFTVGLDSYAQHNPLLGWVKPPDMERIPWEPQSLVFYKDQLHEVFFGTNFHALSMPKSWAREHAFSAYLLAIRDEASSIAKALLLYHMEWPASENPIEGRLCPTVMVTCSFKFGHLNFSAWRSPRSSADVDFQCLTALKQAREVVVKRRQLIEKLRGGKRLYTSKDY